MMDPGKMVAVYRTESAALRAALSWPNLYSWSQPGPTGGHHLQRRTEDDHLLFLCVDGQWRRFDKCWFPPAEITP